MVLIFPARNFVHLLGNGTLITSRHPQTSPKSNGFIGGQAETVKSILGKSKSAGNDFLSCTTHLAFHRSELQLGKSCSTAHGQCDHSLAFFTRSWLFVVHLGVLVFYRFSIIIAFLKPCEFLAFSLTHLGIDENEEWSHC